MLASHKLATILVMLMPGIRHLNQLHYTNVEENFNNFFHEARLKDFIPNITKLSSLIYVNAFKFNTSVWREYFDC